MIFKPIPHTTKNVVITGSSRGIGKALARRFLEQGDNVIITSSNNKHIIHTYLEFTKHSNLKGTCYPFVSDISDSVSCKKLVSYVHNVFSQIDIWINNAAVCKHESFVQHDVHDIQQIINTNLLGTMYCCNIILPIMLSQQHGILINIEGAGSNGLPSPNHSVYGGSKAAITQFTRSLSLEHKAHPVHICTISPGMVVTDLLIKDSNEHMKEIFNIFCEDTEFISHFLIHKINHIESSQNIHYLTIHRILLLLFLSLFRKHRHFDSHGNKIHKK